METISPSPSESVSLLNKAAVFFCICTVLFLPGVIFEKVVDHIKGDCEVARQNNREQGFDVAYSC